MKYCTKCKRQFTEGWLSFCSDDGTPLVQDLTPPKDPNWDPRIRETKVDNPSEQETQWLPRDRPTPPAWVAPDERPPMTPGPWQAPSPPYRRPIKPPSQGLALTSMIVGIAGLFVGPCLGPIPGIIALVLGLIALSQIKKSPQDVGGKPFATAGVVIGALSTAFYLLLTIWFFLAFAVG